VNGEGVLYIAGMDGNLVVCPHETDLGEEATARELERVIMYVRNYLEEKIAAPA
jgi:hypothetical protein